MRVLRFQSSTQGRGRWPCRTRPSRAPRRTRPSYPGRRDDGGQLDLLARAGGAGGAAVGAAECEGALPATPAPSEEAVSESENTRAGPPSGTVLENQVCTSSRIAPPLATLRQFGRHPLPPEHLICRHKAHVTPPKRIRLALIGKTRFGEEEEDGTGRTLAHQLCPARKGAQHI